MEGVGEDVERLRSKSRRAPPGELVFLFVARITKAEREKAMADAFVKARTQAQALAKAAGRELGPMVTLVGGGGGESELMDSPYGYEYQVYLRRLMGRRAAALVGGAEYDEAVAPSADAVEFRFYVRAAFQLLPPETAQPQQ